MKLRVFDRILLALLLIAAIVVSFVLFAVAAKLIKLETATGFVALFYAHPTNAWILAGSGFALLLISVKLLFAGRGQKVVAPTTALIQQNEIGGTFITLAAVDNMAQKHLRANARVRECGTTIRPVEGGVNIGVRLAVLPDTPIVELTQELQKSLKEYIESMSGITVNEVAMLIENTAALPAARVE